MGLISKKAKTSAGKLFGVNHIYGADDGKETVYMTRAWFGRLRFHIFFRGDQDPDCHDHPWGFWTFPLRPYIEEVLEERIEKRWGTDPVTLEGFYRERSYFERRIVVVTAFRWHYRPATYRHRVIGRAVMSPLGFWQGREGVVPTIVWRDKPSRAWGFTKERNGIWCWVPWTDYVFNGGKAAPCQEDIE
jgi:hypothetical protein